MKNRVSGPLKIRLARYIYTRMGSMGTRLLHVCKCHRFKSGERTSRYAMSSQREEVVDLWKVHIGVGHVVQEEQRHSR